MELIINILYHLSSALLIPVVVLLLILLAWSFIELGSFLREGLHRKKTQRAWLDFLATLNESDPKSTCARDLFFKHANYPGLIGAFSLRGKKYKESADELDRIITELEIDGNESFSKMNLWIRVGPMLGLMGTLIPLGPALMGLASADINAMAGNLVVAFSTTVTGLLVGGLCAVMSVSRRHWYVRDLSSVEHLMDTRFIKELDA